MPTLLKRVAVIVFLTMIANARGATTPTRLRVLILGDNGHHRPAEFAKLIGPVLAREGIDADYTADVQALTTRRLTHVDVLLIFRDSGDLPPKEEKALMNFVEGGGGVFALHCASHCFRNSHKYTDLVGGRFLRHGQDVFRAHIIDAQHPAMAGFHSFESWDETYVHDQLASDIRVLMVREENGGYEPYTWVRQQGKGRVFYTALGHDERTWKTSGFQSLLIQGIRWAANRASLSPPAKPMQYVAAEVPSYLRGGQWAQMGEPIRRMQVPLEPEESMKHMHLPEGFEVQLYAAEPDIAKPIAMAWDARGRLWIAETVDYPNEMQPPGQGHDRIRICEDTTGNGRADKFTIFADKLSVPTSLVFANGGLIVAQVPDTLFLKDTTGNDKADLRRLLFSGWGISDTHAVASNFRRGFDNWIWGTVGYSGFDGKVGGRKHHFGQGVYRFKPDGSELEQVTSTSNNTWGLGLSETGQVFASTANNQHSVHLAIPNRYFESVRGWHGQGSAGIEDHKHFHPITNDVRQVDVFDGYTAACGHAFYTARAFPPEYWNRAAFVCEPTGHLVHVDWLTPEGSGYIARDGYNILASDDAWTAPVMAEVGPDGALWVIDWYNYIVQHNPTPSGYKTGKGGAYVTSLRDKTHGRIYRIVYKGARPTPRPALDGAGTRELVAALGNDNLWWRQTAQRLLVERARPGPARETDDHLQVLSLLAEQVRNAANPFAAMHALWTMQGLGAFSSSKDEWRLTLRAGLVHPHAGVRQAALAVMPRTALSTQEILAAKCLADKDPQVRLAALLALSEMPASVGVPPALIGMLGDPRNIQDRWIPTALVSTAARNDMGFLAAAAQADAITGKDAPLAEVVQVVAEHLGRQGPVNNVGRLLQTLSQAAPAVAESMIAGLAKGWPDNRPVSIDQPSETVLVKLPEKLSPGGILRLGALMQRWGQQDKVSRLTAQVLPGLRTRLTNKLLAIEIRLAAARDLVSLGGDDKSVALVLEQITPQAAPALVSGLLEALGQCTANSVGSKLVERWGEMTPAARPSAFGLLLRRAAWTRALLEGLEKGQIDRTELSIDQAQQLGRHPDAALAARARKLLAESGRLPSPDRQKVLDALLPLAKRHGDPMAGKAAFEKNCSKCHRLGSLGNAVGPDLTGIGVRPRADILVDILDPNRSVEGNYRQYTLETKNGLVLTGLLTAETNTAVELLDSEAKKHFVSREDIDTIRSSRLSLMPEGFEKLPADELVSLLDFLTARGKFVPLPLGKSATIASDRGMFIDRNHDVERLIFPSWGSHSIFGIPFQVIDPRDGRIPNAILLYGPQGDICRSMPKSVSVPCNGPAKIIHLLSGVSGWGYPLGTKGSVTMVVRLHYSDGKSEDHPLLNGVQFADYISVMDVPGSKLAFKLRNQQLRYLTVAPGRSTPIEQIEFVKGPDDTAPVVMAVTVEGME